MLTRAIVLLVLLLAAYWLAPFIWWLLSYAVAFAVVCLLALWLACALLT